MKADLLTQEEFVKYRENIPVIKENWWLRSPGFDAAACVYGGNRVSAYGHGMRREFGVRPALHLNPESSNLEAGDNFRFGGHTFTVLDKNLAICNDCIGYSCFRKSWDWEASNANQYEVSDIKKFVDDWYEKEATKKVRGWRDDVPVHDEMLPEGNAFVQALMDKKNTGSFENVTTALIRNGWQAVGQPIEGFDAYCKEKDISYSRISAATQDGSLSMNDDFFDGLTSFSQEDLKEIFDKDIAKYEQLAAESLFVYRNDPFMDLENLLSLELFELLQNWDKAERKIPDVLKITDITYDTNWDEMEGFLKDNPQKAQKLLNLTDEEFDSMDFEQISNMVYERMTDADAFGGTVGITVNDVFDLPREITLPNHVWISKKDFSDIDYAVEDFVVEGYGFVMSNYTLTPAIPKEDILKECGEWYLEKVESACSPEKDYEEIER